MSTITTRRMAENAYDAGHALFQQGRYGEALIELRRAEDSFRKLDAKGHLFGTPLPNGVSGLANTSALSGLCYEKLGDYVIALTCYETSFINAKFEKKQPFLDFSKKLSQNMRSCYEEETKNTDIGKRDAILNQEAEIDISYKFPFSLTKAAIPFARLYELAPVQYGEFQDFYERARKKDSEIRRMFKRTDESTVKKGSVYIWGVLIVIWSIYGLIVADALTHKK
ncbi:MAG TPA: tetratricopeptide repeat protein [Nitrospirota bacterium]|nr:tetratricopeptide repeat protein [Nitrospirota bacterium]